MNIPIELLLYISIKEGIGFSKLKLIIVNKTPIIPWNIRTKKGWRKLKSIKYFSIVLLNAIDKWLKIENIIAIIKLLIVKKISNFCKRNSEIININRQIPIIIKEKIWCLKIDNFNIISR